MTAIILNFHRKRLLVLGMVCLFALPVFSQSPNYLYESSPELSTGMTITHYDESLVGQNIFIKEPQAFVEMWVDTDTPPFKWFRFSIELSITPLLSDGTPEEQEVSTKTLTIESNPFENAANFSDRVRFSLHNRYGLKITVLNMTFEDIGVGMVSISQNVLPAIQELDDLVQLIL